MDTSAMNGSCTSHSLLAMSFTPFTDSTPLLHLHAKSFPLSPCTADAHGPQSGACRRVSLMLRAQAGLAVCGECLLWVQLRHDQHCHCCACEAPPGNLRTCCRSQTRHAGSVEAGKEWGAHERAVVPFWTNVCMPLPSKTRHRQWVPQKQPATAPSYLTLLSISIDSDFWMCPLGGGSDYHCTQLDSGSGHESAPPALQQRQQR